MKKCKVAIIGGGASGICCAITIKQSMPNADVTIYEKLPSLAKKILATGNGRCNLSNENISSEFYDGDRKIVDLVLNDFGTDTCLDFFSKLGLKTLSEEGRIYPLSMNAASVKSVLLQGCKKYDVHVVTDCKIVGLKENGDSFLITSEDGKSYTANACVLALGGKASAVNGTDGDGYKLLKMLGIRYEPICPALVQIRTDNSTYVNLRDIKGIRVQGRISLYENDSSIFSRSPLKTEDGEILFTDYGVSGIPAMQISGKAAQLLLRKKDESPKLVIDLCPSMSEDEISKYITYRISQDTSLTHSDALLGILNEKLARALSDTHENTKAIAHKIKNFTLTVTGTNSYKDAQVTHGGVGSTSLFDGSLSTKGVPGVFICGELLNVDGACGGYNLHFAWGSGIRAGIEVCEFCSE